MNTLLHYDLLRLEAFQKNHAVRNSIAISQERELTLLKFKPINYFNYCLGKIETPHMLDLVREFYSDTVEKQHQILIDSRDEVSKSILSHRLDYRIDQKIAVMSLSSDEPHHRFFHPDIQLKEVTEKEISEFAWLYLDCFDAENRHAESVEENFLHKLRVEGLKFYFVNWNDLHVGITGLYQNGDFQLLSVGAVKNTFRNLGFHKSALSWRIELCRSQNPELPIFSWAYQNSISHMNMIKSGMKLHQEILAYKYVG
ncbi:hypothetical protein [Algoriphagus sp. AK58]|uniref:hypothetical protein n=1 Tax=Algoriphagus sp. AK58 TaxID=1406877 RepID=UPI00164F7234|nr:hypothetical protein [Algoriphagus sp. AK58]MBC6365702.1 hypothetical protein [Algoriphagus sp. AK58]